MGTAAENEKDFDAFESALLGDLPAETEADRVITQESAQVYRARVLLAVLDSPHYDFSDAHITSANPVPVFGYESSDKIGFAAVSLEEGEGKTPKLVADLTIDYSTPERLEIEEGRLYARVAGEWDGHASEEEDAFLLDFYGERVKIDEVRIAYIVLAPEKPRDARILPVGRPVL